MLEVKTVSLQLLQSRRLPLLAVGGLIVNLVELTLVGMVLAGMAILIAHNVQYFREHQFLLVPLVYMFSFLLVALPGFLTVIFISRLTGQRRALAAIILAVIGALAWFCWSTLWFMTMGHDALSKWVILPGFIANAVGQIYAAILIGRRSSKKDLLAYLSSNE